MKNYQLVLASTSPYRKSILDKLHYPFVCCNPQCDETPYSGESPTALVTRLAQAKAQSCHCGVPSLIIGSDQVCVIDGDIVGKPHTRENAIRQLQRQNGKSISFITGLALFNNQTGKIHTTLDIFNVHFRHLTNEQIAYYVDTEQPFHCAGSFMSEGMGIALFEKLEGDDPNSLIGLPLIKLIDLLGREGVDILNPVERHQLP